MTFDSKVRVASFPNLLTLCEHQTLCKHRIHPSLSCDSVAVQEACSGLYEDYHIQRWVVSLHAPTVLLKGGLSWIKIVDCHKFSPAHKVYSTQILVLSETIPNILVKHKLQTIHWLLKGASEARAS